ncbi:Ig-like domain-containing protein [Shewanella surugensis]|uniref:Ig-like domain-containing protein n=1 Tax=Shewanella surugensis TaxID=212020 RepID=A0ABT0L7S0_9GAMM|nr:Ig-like domain-containing protein [Shewanella surugensis]MCL1123216.1 Ig-like domain-containing protein [Shewanella surugensis]
MFCYYINFIQSRHRLWVLLWVLSWELSAANLLDVNMAVSDTTPGAIATYTFSYTTVSDLTASHAVFYVGFPSGFYIVDDPNVQELNICQKLAVKINNIVKTCANSNAWGGNRWIQITEETPAGSIVEVILYGVTNASIAGSRSFGWLKTSTTGGHDVDSVNPVPRVTLIEPNFAPEIKGTANVVTINDHQTVIPFNTLTLFDADDDNLSVSISYSAENGLLSGTGLIGSPGHYSIASETLSNAQNKLQSIVFTPTADQVVVGRSVVTIFSLIANDSRFSSVTHSATEITANSINLSPVISGSPATTILQNSHFYFSPLGSDPDLGDSLSFSITNKPSWASFNTLTGELSGTPTNADVGVSNDIVIAVSDGSLSANLPDFDVSIVNINDAPVISGTPLTAVAQDSAYHFTPVFNDIDGDSLSFSIVNKPSWASFNTLTGELTGMPSNSNVGVTTDIVISVLDENGSTANLASFNLTVSNINDAPVISGTPLTAVAQGSAYHFMPVSNDIDGDSLSFNIVNKPSWASFNTLTGELTGTPTNADVGVTNDIVIAISDGSLSANLPAFDVSVVNVNDAPAISGTPLTAVTQDSAYHFTPVSNDIDGDSLSFSIVNQPSWASFNTLTGGLSGIPSNSDVGVTNNIVISVSDENGSTANLPAFDLSVVNVNDAPSILGGSFVLVSGSKINFWPMINDIDNDHDQLTVSVYQQPEFGQLVNDDNGWTYEASKDYLGLDVFYLTVQDLDLTSEPALFDVNIIAVDKMGLNDVIYQNKTENKVYFLDVLDNDRLASDEDITLVASFSIDGDTSVEGDVIKVVLLNQDNRFVTINYVIENEHDQLAYGQANLVINE